jgi:hypothetical protein
VVFTVSADSFKQVFVMSASLRAHCRKPHGTVTRKCSRVKGGIPGSRPFVAGSQPAGQAELDCNLPTLGERFTEDNVAFNMGRARIEQAR